MQKHLELSSKTNHGVYKMSKKAVWITCGTILGLLVTLMTIAAFFDYQID
jgi:hypothetical protein